MATRDTNRLVRPFEWGLEWLDLAAENGNPLEAVQRRAREALDDSARFFSYRGPSDYRLDGSHLRFTSALASPYPENNTVHADFFPCHRSGGRAVLVLPQWNAGQQGHAGLCRLLNRFGLAALRMSMAYHDRRMPPGLQRADYHVSSNVGRTIHAGRQSVIDARSCLDWLESRGYRRLAVLGTSLGSCIAFIAAAHDARVRAAVLNHVSMYFSDVVWTGLSTQHVRQGLERSITRDDLRSCWLPISQAAHLERVRGRDLRSLLIWARYDSTFLPEFSRQVVGWFATSGTPHQVLCLPCAHYTTGRFPFNWIDGVSMCRFLSREL
ncbi:MAG: alpha/beta hydrolase family protein [Acidobacteria bacterium]|nr:alpha/beta hydrolase family protein [Acidobacteriota bacterium]